MMPNQPKLGSLQVYAGHSDFGIGLIGAGGIVEIGHLPAFQKAGFRIVAVADPVEARRKYSQRALSLKGDQLHSDHRQLLGRSDVQIVDITIPQSSPHKIPVLHEAIEAGKHILVEKPLAMDYASAKAVVEHADRAGVKMAICHQYRWLPVYSAIKNMIDQGFLGELFFLSIDERWEYDSPGSFAQQDRMLLMMQTIHFVDEFRWWTGKEPTQVYATLSRRPGQRVNGETIGTLILNFADDLRATYVANVAAHPQAQQHRIRIEGTGGVLNARHDNLWTPGSLAYSSVHEPSIWFEPQLEGDGFPDGFIGLMSDLMEAIHEDREPAVSGQDNLKTLQVIFAAYESNRLKRAVSPTEIDSGDNEQSFEGKERG